MGQQPLVSILLLSMNHRAFIEKCINSLKCQSYTNIEIIYLDNASSDGTYELGLNQLEESQLNYRAFFNDVSQGISKNLNFLFGFSTGEYLMALSTDDWLTPDSIQEKVQYFLQNPAYGMIYSSCFLYNYDTQKISITVKKGRFKEGWLLKEVLTENFISTVGSMIKRSTFEKVGLFDENSPLEDWDMWIRIAEKFPIGLINKELAYYGVKNGTNITGNIDYMDKGFDYILKKYAHYKEIKATRELVNKVKTYHYANKAPSVKSLRFILVNFKFTFFYIKQLGKTLIGIVKGKVALLA